MTACLWLQELLRKNLDGMAARERDAKATAAAANQAKVAAERVAAKAEEKATKAAIERRRAVASAKQAAEQAAAAVARADAADSAAARMQLAVTVAEAARAEAETAKADAEAEAQRQMAQLTGMDAAAPPDAAGTAAAKTSVAAPDGGGGPLQQLVAQAFDLKEQVDDLARKLEAADAARLAAEANNAQLRLDMGHQATATAAAAAAAQAAAATALAEETAKRVAAETERSEVQQVLERTQAAFRSEALRNEEQGAARLAADLRLKQGVAVKALRKMAQRGLGRAFSGWLSAVKGRLKGRARLARSAARFAHGALAKSWAAWAGCAQSTSQWGRRAAQRYDAEKRELARKLGALQANREELIGHVATLKTESAHTQSGRWF